MSNTTCRPGNEMPELSALGIPKNISVVAIPGRNASGSPPMLACCAPNPVHLAQGCFEWCELPARLFNNSATPAGVQTNFSSCLSSHGRILSESNITGYNFVSSAGRSATTKAGLGVWALLITSAVLGFA